MLVESENYEQLGNAIVELFGDKNKIQRLGENGFNYVKKHYDWNKIIQSYVDFFQRIEN